ncbi:MAG TPA: ABC transporter permease [Ruania sp.]|nr:ABC transporter permease [Ruania sp.]
MTQDHPTSETQDPATDLPETAEAVPPPEQPVGGQDAPRRRGLPTSVVRNLGLVIAFLLLVVIGVVSAGDRFVDGGNALTIISQAAVIGIISIGTTFVITTGGIDLSVGSVLGLSSVWATTLATQAMADQYHWIVIVFTACAVGAACGLVNGILVAYGRIVAFIATLAMMVAARGLAEIISNKQTQIVENNGLLDFLRSSVLKIPMVVWVFAVVAALAWILLNRTTFGRRTVAIGGNPEAARLAGIRVREHLLAVYTLGGLCVGLAAVLMIGRTGVGTSTHGYMYELDAIAAVVVGGTLLIGGRGTIVGTVLGVLIFSMLLNIFTLNNLSLSAQLVTKGAIIVIAVLLQQRFANGGRPGWWRQIFTRTPTPTPVQGGTS